ncbi:MarR family transcriptional regulator [Nocardiopsis sp. ARC36]
MNEIQTLNGSMEEAVLTALLQNLLSMDLTIQQLKVLMILVTTEEGATGRSLSASFGVSMASMSGLLDRLVGQGVATRSTDPHDHRVRRVHATPLGTSVVRRLAVARPFRRDILMGLRMEDLRALEQGFRAVSEQISLMGERD